MSLRGLSQLRYIISACFALGLAFVAGANGQIPLPAAPAPSVTEGERGGARPQPSPTPAAKTESGVKVTFDDKAPGVVIIETANGERLKVDTAAKTIARLEEVAATPAREQVAANTAPPATAQTPEEEEDDEPGSEPYDYRVVNMPTPKRYGKNTLHLYFTHRFAQPIRPLESSAKDLFGLDSFSVSSFGVYYGITDKLYVGAYRSPVRQPEPLSRTIEIGVGYNLWHEKKGGDPLSLAFYGSVEGGENFSKNFTYNLQAQLARSLNKRITLFFAPALHLNSNGNRRFNPRPEDYVPPASTLAANYDLGRHTGSFGLGVNARLTQMLSVDFEYTPRVGFKLGEVETLFDNLGNVTGFKNNNHAAIGFGLQINTARHAFSITFSNTQTTTTSRYNSSNLALSPKNFIIGFNLYRKLW